MCLVKKNLIPRIALKGIVVYKFLRRNINGELCTPTTKNIINIGEVYKGKFNTKDCEGFPSDSPTFLKSLFSESINTGYIHSYINLMLLVNY